MYIQHKMYGTITGVDGFNSIVTFPRFIGSYPKLSCGIVGQLMYYNSLSKALTALNVELIP